MRENAPHDLSTTQTDSIDKSSSIKQEPIPEKD
jgi:hypothetical protein